jgi:hypothetical protein
MDPLAVQPSESARFTPAAHSPTAEPGVPSGHILLVAAITVLAAALRIYHLSYWGLDGAEIFTLRDSLITSQFRGSRPLLYFLNYHLIRPTIGLNETGLRLIPAISGILAVPVIYLLVRRIATSRAGLFAALLLAVNGLHVFRSQHGRYWTLAFLLSAIYPLVLYVGLKEGRRWWIVTGVLVMLLAVSAHPSSGLVAGGLGIWLLYTYARPSELRRLAAGRTARWALLVAAIAALGTAVWLVPLLRNWLSVPHVLRLRGPALLLSHIDGLTVELTLAAMAGILWVGQRDRGLAVLLAGLVLVPVGFLSLLSYGTAVSTAYLFPTAPVFFIGAGIFLEHLASLNVETTTRRLVLAAVLAMILAGDVPGLWSHYRDGGHPDFRGAARALQPQLGSGDRVVSDESRTLQHYLPRARISSLYREPGDLQAALDAVREEGQGGKLWIVARTALRGGFKTHKLGLGKIADWVYGTCQLRASVGRARLDFRANELQVYECPAKPPTHPLAVPSAVRKDSTRAEEKDEDDDND